MKKFLPFFLILVNSSLAARYKTDRDGKPKKIASKKSVQKKSINLKAYCKKKKISCYIKYIQPTYFSTMKIINTKKRINKIRSISTKQNTRQRYFTEREVERLIMRKR